MPYLYSHFRSNLAFHNINNLSDSKYALYNNISMVEQSMTT